MCNDSMAKRLLHHAISLPIVMMLCTPVFLICANASDRSMKHDGYEMDGRQDIRAELLLALKQYRHRVRKMKQRCDLHQAGTRRRDVESLVALANCFKYGVGRPKSLLSAKRLFEQAAILGSYEAHLALGQFYQDGRVVVRNAQRSANHFRKAARGGLPGAMVEFGLVLLRSKSSLLVACNWFERAARAGARNGIRLLGDCYAKSIGHRRDKSRARKLYRKAAQLGDRTAYLKFIDHVFEGYGADIAAREGCDWASDAADRDNPSAFGAVAYCLSVTR